jgi:hypothetical protein
LTPDLEHAARMSLGAGLVFILRWRLCAVLLSIIDGLMWLTRKVAPRP